jgi:Tfp pilus assembly protein PilV
MARRDRQKAGLSLVDTISAIAVVGVVVIGAANFKYYAVRDAVRAERQIVAARTASMFSQAWQGCDGDQNFDPNACFQGIITLSAGTMLNAPNDYNVIGSFNTTIDGVAQNVTLSYKDISPQLRALNTSVSWSRFVDEPDRQSLADDCFQLTAYCDK